MNKDRQDKHFTTKYGPTCWSGRTGVAYGTPKHGEWTERGFRPYSSVLEYIPVTPDHDGCRLIAPNAGRNRLGGGTYYAGHFFVDGDRMDGHTGGAHDTGCPECDDSKRRLGPCNDADRRLGVHKDADHTRCSAEGPCLEEARRIAMREPG